MSRIKYLEEVLVKAKNDYYNHQPSIPDDVFDVLMDELRSLDPKNPVVTSVGAPVTSSWEKRNHIIPMGSLDKVNTPQEFLTWANSTNSNEFIVTEKLDGISLEVVYSNGNIVDAITRGDGLTGESILKNFVKMKGALVYIDGFSGSLRGEIIMTKQDHKSFFPDKANPRNAASGTAKRFDGVGCQHLCVIFYQSIGSSEFKTEEEQFVWLKNKNLNVPNYKVIFKDDVSDYWDNYQKTIRDDLSYEIDGLVIRVNDMEKQLLLGDKDLRPKGAIAFKFDNIVKESIIKDVVWQVGNSGRLTPVANILPVSIGGAVVTNVSLYNQAYIDKLDIHINDFVQVTRANDVIPRIISCRRSPDSFSKKIESTDICPACQNKTHFDGENLICSHYLCPAQISGRIKNWVSALNLLEWGDTLVSRLVETKKVTTIADLYRVTVDDLANIDRMGQKSAKKCYEILHSNKDIPLDIFLGSLTIPMIGPTTIKSIMNEGCDTLEKFGQLTAQEFMMVQGIGPAKAKFLQSGLIENKELILDILSTGVTIKNKVQGVFTGKSVCFTGTMVNKRNVLEKMVIDAGGEVKSSVNKGLSFLVIADVNSTSSKAVAARKFGTKLISEDDFLKLVS